MDKSPLEQALDDLSLRPLRDMQEMPHVREMRFRTRWDSASGSMRLIDVIVMVRDVSRWAAWAWRCEEVNVATPGEPGVDPGIDSPDMTFNSPLAAYEDAQEVIGEWLDTGIA